MESTDSANGQFDPYEEVERLASAVIGAAIEVHRILGPGYAESVYENALCIELAVREVRFVRQKPIALFYKQSLVGEARLDLLISNLLVVELKSVESLLPVHKAQLISYLKATACPLGLLINFNVAILRDGIKRVILSRPEPAPVENNKNQ